MKMKKWMGVVVLAALFVGGCFYGGYKLYSRTPASYEELRVGKSGEENSLLEELSVSKDKKVKKDVWRSCKVGMESYEYFCGESFLGVVSQNKDKNVLYSPINVYLILGMLANCSEGETQDEILDAIKAEDWYNTCGNVTEEERRTGRVKTLEQICTKLLKQKKGSKETRMISNSIWLRDNIPFDKQKIQSLQNKFNMEAFKGNMDCKMTQALHEWLNQATGGKLSEDVGKTGFSPEALCSIYSTLLFEDKWRDSFETDMTAPGDFYESNGDKKTVDFMNDSRQSAFKKEKNYCWLKLDFAKSGASMTLYLPDEKSTVDEMLEKENMKIMQIAKKQQEPEGEEVDISIPKLENSVSDSDLKPVLRNMGIKRLFQRGKANLNPLFENKEKDAKNIVGVDDFKQSAFMKVDEGGCSVASFATEMLCGSAMVEEKNQFICNRPFAYVIRNDYGIPIFAGVVRRIK